MALTRDFKETVRARAQRDPGFRAALIEEVIESLLEGDLDSGRSILSHSFIGRCYDAKRHIWLC